MVKICYHNLHVFSRKICRRIVMSGSPSVFEDPNRSADVSSLRINVPKTGVSKYAKKEAGPECSGSASYGAS
jgi:hypothetical protein